MKDPTITSYGFAAIALPLVMSFAALGAGCSSDAAGETSSANANASAGGSASTSGGTMGSGPNGGTGGTSTATGGVTCLGTQVACGGGCVEPASFQADAKNCGACGHDCQGGTCTKGACQSAQVFSPGEPKNGKPLGVRELALDSKFVYFNDSSSLFRCPKEGCGANGSDLVTVSKSDPSMSPLWSGPLRVEGTKVFSFQAGNSAITSCDLSSPLPNGSLFYKAPTNDSQLDLVGDQQGYVYFTDMKFILRRCPASGCGPNGENVQVVASDHRGGITFDTNSIYLGVGTTLGNLVKCPRSGCGEGNANGALLATGLQGPISAANDAQNIYFALFDSIAKCPKAGCGDKNKDLVTLYTNTSPGVIIPYNLLVDANYIYWLDMTADPAKVPESQILRCPKSGCGDKNSLAVPIAKGRGLWSLVQDDKSVYWIHSPDQSGSKDQIMRLAK